MAKAIHVLELPVEIKPLCPRVERRPPFMAHVCVSAAGVAFRVWKTAPFAKLLKEISRPPMKMGVDDPHDTESIPLVVRGRGDLTNKGGKELEIASSGVSASENLKCRNVGSCNLQWFSDV